MSNNSEETQEENMAFIYSEPRSYAVSPNSSIVIENIYRKSVQYSLVGVSWKNGGFNAGYIGNGIINPAAIQAQLNANSFNDFTGLCFGQNYMIGPHWFECSRFLTFFATNYCMVTLQFRYESEVTRNFRGMEVVTDKALEHVLQPEMTVNENG